MKEKICDILSEIDLEIDEIDLYIKTSLSMSFQIIASSYTNILYPQLCIFGV